MRKRKSERERERERGRRKREGEERKRREGEQRVEARARDKVGGEKIHEGGGEAEGKEKAGGRGIDDRTEGMKWLHIKEGGRVSEIGLCFLTIINMCNPPEYKQKQILAPFLHSPPPSLFSSFLCFPL